MYNETATAILEEYDSNLNYYPSDGFKREEYNLLYFAEPCDVYQSSDLIINLQNGYRVVVDAGHLEKKFLKN